MRDSLLNNMHGMSDNGLALSALSTAEIEAKEMKKLLELQQAILEREKHSLELQVQNATHVHVNLEMADDMCAVMYVLPCMC